MFSVTLGKSNNLSGPHFPYLLVEQIVLKSIFQAKVL